MIQRQQTLWLLLAAAAAFFTFQFPFYTGDYLENNINQFKELEAGSNLFLLILTGLALVLAAVTIFLFKDRKTQLKLAIAGLIVSIVILVLYFVETGKFVKGNFALTCIFAFAIFIGFVMAIRGIVKDERLVKSLDKLR
ncbi:MAG: DUF4293 family protein [Chitinophagaceae bacterium]|nr:MAG: DUF4293 family protein [Chitinophagaceae bacterium]